MLSFLSYKYPLVRQYDQIDCGPACLLSILKYYKGNTSLVHMRELCNTGSNGSTMFDVICAAKEIGFDAFGAEGEYKDLINETMPCIAHVVLNNNLNHFIVIYKIDDTRLYVADPGEGRYYITKEEFLNIWKKKAVILLKPEKELIKLEAPVWYKWIISYLKKEDTWIYQSIFLGLIYTIISLLTAVFVQVIIDKYIPEQKIWKVFYTGLFLIILLGVKVFAGYIRQRFLVELNKKISISINTDFISHIFKLPKKFFDTRKTGDITARINDALKIQQAVLGITGKTAIDLLVVTASFILLFQFSAALAYVAVCVVPVYLVMMIYGALKLKVYQREVMKNYSFVESSYIDSLNGIDEIISYNASGYFTNINKSLFRNYQDKIKSLGFLQANLSFASEGFGSLVSISMLVFGAYLVVNKDIMLGQMMASFSLFGTIMPSINSMVGSLVGLQGASIASQRLMDLFLVQTEKTDGYKIKAEFSVLELRNVVFGWDNRNFLIKNVNMQIPKGKITALYGASGSGKTTIVNILQRKYKLSSGSIHLDDVDADTLDLEDYRKYVAVVPQNIKIFNGTLLDNILIGRILPSLEELNKKIKELGFEDFLKRFEQHYFTQLGEDSRHLSGGEKQVIALIRAMYTKPRILIIDEGLSGLDPDLEYLIFNSFKKYSRENSLLIVTHNKKTLERCEHIYKLENGEIKLISHNYQKIYEDTNIKLV